VIHATTFSIPCLALLALLVPSPVASSHPHPSVPSGPPVFSHPLVITNDYAPFAAGASKVYLGVTAHGSHGETLEVHDDYLADTRTFQVHGTPVQTRVLRETSIEGGILVEISRNHFAQADDGTVYYFGETVDIYDDAGVNVVSHEGSWLVGGATLPGDPIDTADASDPTVFMPANPQRGDVFKAEDLMPFVDETDTVKRIGLDVTVPAGTFEDAILVLETSQLDPVGEKKWYAPGLGVVEALAQDGEHYELVSSTLP
jgi:hypothetical protein